MKSTLLTSKEALRVLGLTDYRVLNYLNKRDLLPRIVLGPRTFRYEKEDCEDLLNRVKNEGITLTKRL